MKRFSAKVLGGLAAVALLIATVGFGFGFFDDADSADADSDAHYVTQEENEAAVQATLACLADHGMVPDPAPARGKLVTRLGGTWPADMSIDEAQSIVADCAAATGLREIQDQVANQQLAAPESEKQAARDFYNACIEASGEAQPIADARCLEDTIAETGLPPIAPWLSQGE